MLLFARSRPVGRRAGVGGVLALPVEAGRVHRVVPVHRGWREAGVGLLEREEEEVRSVIP